MKISAPAFRRSLLGWYNTAHRSLPWRQPPGSGNAPFYPVWISEIMLQQTRVEAVIPYYHRFLARFPSVFSLAAAAEADVLGMWSGLGYYSRARGLHRAARHVAERGVPASYEEILALPAAGPYTAAAIASITLGLPHAAVDGNVMRVVSRLTNDASEVTAPGARKNLAAEAQRLLDRNRPGDFNQAMMELGATVCLPRNPRCDGCPVVRFCAGRAAGRERELPVKSRKTSARDIPLHLVCFVREGEIFLIRRGDSEKRLAGFWELPAKRKFPKAEGSLAISFTHRIVNDRFRITVTEAAPPPGLSADCGRWFARNELGTLPVTTVTRKALTAFAESGNRSAAGAVKVIKNEARRRFHHSDGRDLP